MITTKITKSDNPFRLVSSLKGNNPYSQFINLKKAVGECSYFLLKVYQAIEDAKRTDPAGWRLVAAEMDERLYGVPELMGRGIEEIFTLMEQIGLMGGQNES